MNGLDKMAMFNRLITIFMGRDSRTLIMFKIFFCYRIECQRNWTYQEQKCQTRKLKLNEVCANRPVFLAARAPGSKYLHVGFQRNSPFGARLSCFRAVSNSTVFATVLSGSQILAPAHLFILTHTYTYPYTNHG